MEELECKIIFLPFPVEQYFNVPFSVDSNGDEIEKLGLKSVSADL